MYFSLFVATVLLYAINYVSAGHHGTHSHGSHTSGSGHGHRHSHHQVSSVSRGSGGSRHSSSFGRNYESSRHRTGHSKTHEHHHSVLTRHNHHQLEPRPHQHHKSSSNTIISQRGHLSKQSNNVVNTINNYKHGDSFHHGHRGSHRNRAPLSVNSLRISPTINSVFYNNPVPVATYPRVIGPLNVEPVLAVSPIIAVNSAPIIPFNSGPIIPYGADPYYPGAYPSNPPPQLLNYPGRYPGYPPPQSLDYPGRLPEGLHQPNIINSEPRGPRCFQEYRQITEDGKEIKLIRLFYLDDFYQNDNYNFANGIDPSYVYPCDFYPELIQ